MLLPAMVVNMVILKLSRKIVNENQVIAVENLNAKAMVRNHNLRDLRFDNVPFRAGLILLQSDFLAGILFLCKSLRPKAGR